MQVVESELAIGAPPSVNGWVPDDGIEPQCRTSMPRFYPVSPQIGCMVDTLGCFYDYD
jgi:hypothetical protein